MVKKNLLILIRSKRFLIVQRLVNEGPRLVGAGHHTVAAANANVAVDKDNTVSAPEGCAGGADVDTWWLSTVLTHERHLEGRTVLRARYLEGANPLSVGGKVLGFGYAVFYFARGNAGVAAFFALAGVNQQPPSLGG